LSRRIPPKSLRKIDKHMKQKAQHNEKLLRIILQLVHSGDLPKGGFSASRIADIESPEATAGSDAAEVRPVDSTETTTVSDPAEVEPVGPSKVTMGSDPTNFKPVGPSNATTGSALAEVKAVDTNDDSSEPRSCDDINTDLQKTFDLQIFLPQRRMPERLARTLTSVVARIEAECQLEKCILMDVQGELPQCIREKPNRVARLKEEARLFKTDPAMENKEAHIM